jgi:dipeptidase E
MNLLLTSAGFETEALQNTFLSLINKEPKDIRAIFVPTAAVNSDAIAVLPKCMNDLLKLDIPSRNIFVYDLHVRLSIEEMKQYDAIYFCGGDTRYLLNRINELKFGSVIKEYLDYGGIFVGVSAGSIIAASNLPDNLGYVPCPISVHCDIGTTSGHLDIDNCNLIKLTNSQSLLVTETSYTIIE